MQLNQFTIYAMNAGAKSNDTVDYVIHDLKRFKKYDEVLNYLKNRYKHLSEHSIMRYQKIQKEVDIKNNEDQVEVIILKGEDVLYRNLWVNEPAEAA